MADTTTELEVLDEIVDVLGGQSGQHKTVVPVLEDIRDLLGGGGGGGSYNPSLSVGRADALTGADSTAQWAQRVTAGSGAATVRSVQGAAEVQDDELVPVRIAGIQSNGFNRFKLDGRTNVIFPSYSASDKRAMSESNIFQGITINNIGGSSLVNFTTTDNGYVVTATSNGYGLGFPVPVSPNTTYHVQHGSTGPIGVGCYAEDGTYIRFYGGSASSVDFTAPDNCQWIMVVLRPAINTPTTYENICVNVSSARNGEYEPYRIVDSVEWEAQTLRAAGNVADMLYSDHVDVRVGVVDLGTLNWTYNTSYDYHFFYPNNSMPTDFKVAPSSGLTDYVACAKYTVVQSASSGGFRSTDYDGCICPITNAGYKFAIQDTNYTDAATFKAAMSGVLLFYPLATPTTTPINPALPMTYRVEQGGSEAIILPTGEVSAAPVLTVAEGESAADVVMDALACIAAPDGPVATSNHAVNTYLTMQGKLYKVTSAIAVGETIKSGTNVTQTTVMAELIARTA